MAGDVVVLAVVRKPVDETVRSYLGIQVVASHRHMEMSDLHRPAFFC